MLGIRPARSARCLTSSARLRFSSSDTGVGALILKDTAAAFCCCFILDLSYAVAAGIVGPAGEVVGIDRELAALEVARSRASSKALSTVTFAEAQSNAQALSQPFDAVIGRYVLQFQPDPAAMLRELTVKLKPSGLIVFHEIDWSGLRSFPPLRTFDQVCRWGTETLRRHGTETQMGLKLFETFIAAGLPPPTIRLEAPIGGAPEINSWLRMFVDLIAVLLPQMEHLGVAKSDEVGLNTLYERLRSEAELHSAVLVGHHQVGAWTRCDGA